LTVLPTKQRIKVPGPRTDTLIFVALVPLVMAKPKAPTVADVTAPPPLQSAGSTRAPPRSCSATSAAVEVARATTGPLTVAPSETSRRTAVSDGEVIVMPPTSTAQLAVVRTTTLAIAMVDSTVRLFIGASHTTVASTRPAALPTGAVTVTSVVEVMEGPALRVFVTKGFM
jgi:hypothetical protein